MATYIIWNDTDKIIASNKTFRKIETAEKHIETLRNIFRKRGYYFTNRQERINPDNVQYRIIERNKMFEML